MAPGRFSRGGLPVPVQTRVKRTQAVGVGGQCSKGRC